MIRSLIELRATTVVPLHAPDLQHTCEALQGKGNRWARPSPRFHGGRKANRRGSTRAIANPLIPLALRRAVRIGAVRRECSTDTPPSDQPWNMPPIATIALPKNGMGSRGRFAQAGAQ